MDKVKEKSAQDVFITCFSIDLWCTVQFVAPDIVDTDLSTYRMSAGFAELKKSLIDKFYMQKSSTSVKMVLYEFL